MRKLIYGILIAAAMLVPSRPLELGKLKPVEVIRIDKRGAQILIETDTGDGGQGKTVAEAIRDLKETTAGTVYLDTAEYLMVPEGEMVPVQLIPYLRGNVRICEWKGEMKLEEVAKYLNVHKPDVRLKEYQMGMALQTLEGEKDRLLLLENNIERRAKNT